MGVQRTFGEIIASYCKWTDISQSAFARRLGVSRAYMSQLVTGYVTRQAGVKTQVDPSLSTMRRVAEEMGLSFSQLAEMMDGNLGTDPSDWERITSHHYVYDPMAGSGHDDEEISRLADLVAANLAAREKE